MLADAKSYKWFLFGIVQFGAKISTWFHPSACGVSCNGPLNDYRKNGQILHDNKLAFLYQNQIDQIDMLLDCKNGTLSYKLVDNHSENEREFTIDGLNTDIKWIPLFDCNYEGGKLQVAKIPVSMYGKNKEWVEWLVKY